MSNAQNPMAAQRQALMLLGFSAVIGQIVLMREFIVAFNGNEMSVGIMLATWLFWTATGSCLGSGFGLVGSNPRRTTALLECLLAISLPATICGLRLSKSIFQAVPGELVGPIPMRLVSLLCLSLFCIVSGALFVTATQMKETECSKLASSAAGWSYLLEAVGSAVGGIVASMVLLRFLGAFQIAAIVSLLNLCMTIVLMLRMNPKHVGALALIMSIPAFVMVVFIAPQVDKYSQARLWNGFHLIGVRDTIYGNLAVTETGANRSIYDNGVILATAPDESAAEEAVHYALLEHPAPHEVLLIGGGLNGSIANVLKHPTVERIDYVELDPALIEMARQFFSAQTAALNSDPRVHLHYSDGRRYLKTVGNKFDVIIVNLPDPQTAQVNRFYTAEFFSSARDHLAPGGLLALGLRSSGETISPNLAEFLRCIQRTFHEVFPYRAIIPGETIHFFGAMRPGVLTEDPQILIAHLRERHLLTQYVSEYFIPYRMMPDRMVQVHEQLQPLPSTPVNRDFAPVAYYFDVVLWSAQFKSSYSGWFRVAAQIPFRWVLGVAVVISLIATIVFVLLPTRERRTRSLAAYCTLATGFTLMVLQIFLLLAFQCMYGYVYHQLAILIGLCMAGIAFGSWLRVRRTHLDGVAAFRSLAATQFLIALSVPLLLLVFNYFASISEGPTSWIAAQVVFPALAALSGILGGYQFPLAAEIYLRDRKRRSGLGRLYAVDLLGGCVGALLLCTYLIPVFGLGKTAWLSAALNLAPALLAARASLKSQEARA